MIYIDIIKFEKACKSVSEKNNNIKDVEVFSIGTMKEKSVHAVLKYYFEPNPKYHEIKINNFIADISNEKEIFEIQSSSFYLLKSKLNTYLKNHKVTIVYPVIALKYINWINPSTKKICDIRKSPKSENYNHIFSELYGIKSFLNDENLNFALVKMQADEFKYLDGFGKNKKNKATKGDIFPTKIFDVLYLEKSSDFFKLLPDNLENVFTTKKYAKCAKITQKKAQMSLNILHHLKVVKRVGKKGNNYLYEINFSSSH